MSAGRPLSRSRGENQLNEGYRIRFAPKEEGVEYRDDTGVYRFSVLLKRRVWTVDLPCWKGEPHEKHHLSHEGRGKGFCRESSSFLARSSGSGFRDVLQCHG